MDVTARVAQYDEVLRRFASGIRGAQLYARDHPLVAKNVDGLLAALKPLLQQSPALTVGIVAGQLVVADTPMPKATATMGELMKRLTDSRIERISFERGITADEALGFMLAVAAISGKSPTDLTWNFPHIKVGRITAEDRRDDGVAGDMAAIRRLYAGAVTAAQTVWDAAQT